MTDRSNREDMVDRRIDYDLQSNYDYNLGGGPFLLTEIAYVLAAVMGENDGPSYHWICAMKDHTYAYVSGSCDYTGWDCQSGGEVEILPTLKMAIDKLPEVDDSRKIKESILQQLVGECAFGEALES